MRFDNASFMKGAADTQKSLADLNKGVDAAGNTKGLTNLSDQMGQVSISASKMQVATVAAIGTIAAKATALGLNVIKGLTFEPIAAGFAEYEENLNKLNTIMNATGKSEKVVQGVLTNLNAYSDKTIYSFSNMTTSIQKFVNAGVPLGESVEAIKGIANAAAYSGATTEEANRAMFAFSQTMGTGFMMLNDWQQIENANMGTVKFKQTLIDTAVAAGTLTKQGNAYVTSTGKTVSATKGWRESLQEQWATTEVVTGALSKYTDTQTKLGRAATESAMEYRTFTAFFDSFKESLGSGWAKIFDALIGGLDEATHFWTSFANSVTGVTGAFFEFTANALKTWRTMGGFEKTIQGFKNLLAPLGAIFRVVGAALSAAFPSGNKGVGKTLYTMSAGFEAITRPLQWFADVIEGTTPVIATFFRMLHLIGAAIKSAGGTVANFVKDLLGMVSIQVPSGSGFIGFIKDLAKAVSDASKKVDELVQKGASVGAAFGAVDFKMPSMPDMPSMPKLSMPSLGGGDKAASGVSTMSASVGDLTGNVSRLKSVSDSLKNSTIFNSATMASAKDSFRSVGDGAKDAAGGVVSAGEWIKNAWGSVVDFLGPIFSKIKDFIGGISADDIVSSFNMAIFATMGIQLAKFIHTLNNMLDMVNSFAQIGPAFTNVLDSAGGALKSFQTQAQAKL
ncbi:MAG TPA: tape measure protein, partial [Nitrospira sp.]|nr:tape measure protein [Nitrospira sp.]